MNQNYVSGGRNPNWQRTCFDCEFLEQGENMTGGWCKHTGNLHDNGKMSWTPSVSWDGGCDEHKTKVQP